MQNNHSITTHQIKQKKKITLGNQSIAFWLFISPCAILFTIFFLLPLVLNIYFSFTNYDGWKTMDFIGLGNYTKILTDSTFFKAFGRTMIYAITNVPFKVGIPLLLAILMTSEKIKAKTFTRTLIYLPVLLSSLVVGITINWMFSQEYGLINFLITSLGGSALEWGTNPILATIIISIANIWATTGFYMIIYIGAINNIPKDIYESADIDGASPWYQFSRITFPLLAPTTFLVTLLCSINLLKEYALIQGVTQGGPGTSTTFIIQYIFDKGFNQSQYGYASAAAVLVMIVFALIAFVQFKINNGGENIK